MNNKSEQKGGEELTNDIGKRLKELRGKKTQAEVAKAIGISVSSLSMYEQNERTPRDATKIKLAAYFKKSVQSIFFAK